VQLVVAVSHFFFLKTLANLSGSSLGTVLHHIEEKSTLALTLNFSSIRKKNALTTAELVHPLFLNLVKSEFTILVGVYRCFFRS
jgi:hypothetical protein